MKNKLTYLFIALITISFLFPVNLLAAGKAPVALAFSPKGKVEYNKKGKKWRKVRRKKFMFADYKLRTGSNGTVKVLNHKTNITSIIQNNSLVIIQPENIQVVSGNVTVAGSSGVNLFGGLKKKFLKSQKLTQKYTTVRRSLKKSKSEVPKLKVARKLVVSNDHPYLVWDNIGADYSYQIKLGKNLIKVAPALGKLVKTKIPLFKGTVKYQISVLKADKVLFTTKKVRLTWLDINKNKEYKTGLRNLKRNPGFNDFFHAVFLENHGLLVGAMNKYRRFLKENPDNNDMRPFLIRTYKKLKLASLASNEQDIYHKQQEK